MSKNDFHYDDVPYPSFTFPQTRPDRLATLAAFFGMSPARPDKCRVLELGCGDGTNLLSFAYILPESEFVGVDLSKLHIDNGQKAADELGLTNLSLYHEDVLNFNRERFGEFDFIVAHGLYSWVPDFVREKVLQIYSECLAPQGVGYISYNAYPGCRVREMAWEMMKFHARGVEEPMRMVNHGATFLRFLAESVKDDGLYQALIKTELQHFAERTPENIFHDDFAGINQPFYFHEFVKHIQPHGLQFLAEVDAFWIESGGISGEIAKKLDDLGDDVIRREQYIDFIKNRRFRSTLICRENLVLNRRPKSDILQNFYLASQVRPESETPNLNDAKLETFLGAEGGTTQTNHPLTKSALVHLGKSWTRCIPFPDLMDEARVLCGESTEKNFKEESEKAAANLLEMFRAGFVYLHKFQPHFASEAGEFPKASAFARWQVQRKSETITSLSGMSLKPDSDFMRLILVLLDGTRDRSALISDAASRIESDANKKAKLKVQLPKIIDAQLSELAKMGLLLQ